MRRKLLRENGGGGTRTHVGCYPQPRFSRPDRAFPPSSCKYAGVLLPTSSPTSQCVGVSLCSRKTPIPGGQSRGLRVTRAGPPPWGTATPRESAHRSPPGSPLSGSHPGDGARYSAVLPAPAPTNHLDEVKRGVQARRAGAEEERDRHHATDDAIPCHNGLLACAPEKNNGDRRTTRVNSGDSSDPHRATPDFYQLPATTLRPPVDQFPACATVSWRPSRSARSLS